MNVEQKFEQFVGWVAVLTEADDFVEAERAYKLELSGGFLEILSAGLRAERITRWLDTSPNNIVGWRSVRSLADEADEAEMVEAVGLLVGDGDLAERVQLFAQWLHRTTGAAAGDQTTLASTLLMGVDPVRFPPYKTTAIQQALRLAGRATPGGSPEIRYLNFLEFCDEVLAALDGRTSRPLDRLDVQGACWIIGGWAPADVAELIPNHHGDFEFWRSASSAQVPAPSTKPGRLWAIYVGRRSESNLAFSLPKGRWGWKAPQETYEAMEPGDLIAFATGHTGGNVRTALPVFEKHNIERLIVGRVTSKVYVDDTPFWPDENDSVSYPYRVDFEKVEERGITPLSSVDDLFGGPVVEGLRMSAINQSQAEMVAVSNTTSTSETSSFDEVIDSFSSAVLAAELSYGSRHDTLVRSFVTALATKPFVILTGLSGSGKTRLAQTFGHWIGTAKVIPVRPDWTSPDALLGFENSLSQPIGGDYAWNVPDSLEFILEAISQPGKPHLLLLDEMNLAHVERYFADVLSGMESGEPVIPDLVCGEDGSFRIREDSSGLLTLPKNLLIVGTVNMDETTYMFSPKVLDRANTFEFRVATEDLVSASGGLVSSSAEPKHAAGFLQAATATAPPAPEELAESLLLAHSILSRHDHEFGHRTYQEALRFGGLLQLAGETDPLVMLDLQIAQKVLPRLHGSRRELTDLLNDLAGFCFVGPAGKASPGFDAAAKAASPGVLPISYAKLHRMARKLKANHFVSFAE